MKNPVLKLSPGAIKLKGLLGQALQRSAVNRLMRVNYKQLVDPFRFRNETDGAWRCEFWGKIVRSAILTNFSLQDAELARCIEETVRDIISTQTPDGCISSYPVELQTRRWDIWGRKYVLLGLLRYYDYCSEDPRVKQCCCDLLDHLMTQVGPGKKSILACGEHGGLAASSILGAVVGVYRISKQQRYLDFAQYIVQQGASKKHNIFTAAKNGTPPAELGNGKAYEMTSCFQGLAELHQIAPNPEYVDICKKYFQAVRDREIFVTGIAGGKDRVGEFWFDGASKQTRSDVGGLGETCITTTWLHYCERILGLDSDISAAEQAERALYNGILGAMSPDGSSWTHVNPTPLTGGGWKAPAVDQIQRCFGTPFGGNDCCLAQGPEGLALTPRLAVIPRKHSVTLNLFEPLTAELPDGVRIEITGNYPITPEASVRMTAANPHALIVRIPSFTQSVTLNKQAINFTPGKYLTLERTWLPSDELILKFDFSLKEIPAPDQSPYTALKRGPLVLANDSRGRNSTWNRHVQETWKGIQLCDYASAGNEMRPENTLTVWLPNNR